MSHQRKIYPMMLISTLSCTKCQHAQPKAFLRRVWASISNSDLCILRLQTRAAWGFGRRKGTSCTATPAVLLFGNLAACLCSPFFILASHAPWRVLLLSPVFIKVSLQLLESWWDAGASDIWGGGVTECVFTCCLAQLREMCEGVWRQSGHVCDLKRLNGDGSTPLPSHPHSPYPDKGKPLTGSDGAKLVRIALPAPLSSPPCRSSLFSVRLFLCHSASVFGGGLHKSRTASPSGRHRILIEKEIRNENSHSFSGLCSVKVRKCTTGKKTKCGVDERNRSCS